MPFVTAVSTPTNSRYEHQFAIADWNLVSGGDSWLSITEATHGQGIRPDVGLWGDTSGNIPNYSIDDDDNGNLTITIAAGSEFAGYAVIG